jgi:hypothetical protein
VALREMACRIIVYCENRCRERNCLRDQTASCADCSRVSVRRAQDHVGARFLVGAFRSIKASFESRLWHPITDNYEALASRQMLNNKARPICFFLCEGSVGSGFKPRSVAGCVAGWSSAPVEQGWRDPQTAEGSRRETDVDGCRSGTACPGNCHRCKK